MRHHTFSFHYRPSFVIVFCFLFFQINHSFSQKNFAAGSGYCLDFTANQLNGNCVDLGSLAAIDTGNFSIEMWVNVAACIGDPPFFSNKDWSSGNNPGIVFDVHDNGTKLRINLKPGNSTFQNIILPINSIGRGWFHLAVTLDRSTYLKIYIDGILKSSTYLENGLLGSFKSPYTYKLGQDGTGAYTDDNGTLIQYNGKIDEVRIWKRERTEDEIKADMCKKVSALLPDLYAYYNCDTIAGSIVRDLKGKQDGKWVKGVPANWKVSGAPLGDTSVALYPESLDWDGKTLRLSDTLLGAMKIKNVLAVEGVHLYKVNSKPDFTKGLYTFSNNATYYGVFLAGITTGTAYDASFEYANYANAVTDESHLKLFTRNQNSDHLWSDYMAEQDAAKDNLIKAKIKKRREFILGTKTGVTCTASTTFTMGIKTDKSCEVAWTGGGAIKWNTEWGAEGFELGTGNSTFNSSTNPQNVTNLKIGSFYEFYEQDTCSATSASYWAGPFLFYPESCLPPTNFQASSITNKSALLTWKGNGSKSDVEWGLVGFILGQGIPDSTFTDTLLLTGLSPNTSYAYYVKDNCLGGNNNYQGPFTFKTLEKSGVNENELFRNFSLYPNPTTGEFTLLIHTSSKQLIIRIYNALGKEIVNSRELNKNGSIKQSYDLKGLPKGLYFIGVTDGTDIATKAIIIQ